MSRLLKNLGIRPSSRRSRVSEIEVAGASDVGPLLYWAEPAIDLRMSLPIDWLRMQGAFGYSGWHPFVAALRQGPSALEEFYRLFAPRDFAAMYFLGLPCDIPPWELPWIGRQRRLPPPGEAGLGAEHGVSFFGPATPQKVNVEYERLCTLDSSFTARGYDPNEKGGIAGHYMRRGGEVRFFIRSGKHRTAVLAYQGAKRVPVAFRKNWPRLVDRDDATDWPLVRTGAISIEAAREAFDRYFDFDGTQQRALWTGLR